MAYHEAPYAVIGLERKVDKMVLLDCETGQLFISTLLRSSGEKLPCVPPMLVQIGTHVKEEECQDGLLLWLEEHLRQLQSGRIQMAGISESPESCISLFPVVPPFCSTTMMNGFKVFGTAVFAPEACALAFRPPCYVYYVCFQISHNLEMCEVEPEWTSVAISRQLKISFEEKTVSDFYRYNPKALVLPKGGKVTVHIKVTLQSDSGGTIGGDIMLSPMRDDRQYGDQLTVKIGRFNLLKPSGYIY